MAVGFFGTRLCGAAGGCDARQCPALAHRHSRFPAPAATQAGANIASVVRADLERSGLFKPIDPKAFVDHDHQYQYRAQFRQLAGDQCARPGDRQVTLQPDGRLKGRFPAVGRLWRKPDAGQQFFTQPENWRRVAHLVSDAIYERITGEKGYFDTRIVFISESGPALTASSAWR